MSTPYCTDLILPLANQIWQDIGTPPNISIGFISGWATSTGGMIGGLNNRLGTCVYLSGTNPCLVNFDPELGVIANYIYQVGYYKNERIRTLQGGGQALWTRLREGDSSVERSDMVKAASEWGRMQADAQKELDKQIHYWTLNHSIPQGIDSVSLYSYPSP